MNPNGPAGFHYQGDHGNRVRERFEAHVLPFFSRHLRTP